MAVPSQLRADIAVGENILFNPTLVKDQSELPQGWVVPSNADAPHVIADYAPGGQTAFVFRGADLPGGTSVRQKDIGLVPGCRYRLDFKAKTVGFRGGTALCVVADAKWKADAGVREFPENSDWADYTAEFVCMPRVKRSDGTDRYQFVLSVGKGFSGEVAFSHLKLEAIDEQSRAGTEKMRLPEVVTRPRIIPLSPLLHRIDREDPRITIAFRNFDAKAKRLMIRMTANGEKEERLFADEQSFRLDRASDRGAFDVAVVEAESGRVVSQRSFSYAKVSRPPTIGPAPRRLNNFVSELPVDESAEAGKRFFRFTLAKPGWVYVNDGGQESIRRHEAGTHRLSASSGDSARPIVRSIGDIYYYSPLTDSRIDNMPKRTWEQFVGEVLPNVTTFDGAWKLTDEQAAFVQAAGRHLETIFVSREFKTREEFDCALRTNRAMTQPRYDGAVLDEQFFDRQEHLDLCTEALWKFNLECPDEKHRVAAAIVGNPMSGALDTDFLSAVANASQGRGVLNVEAYYRTKATESEAYTEIRRAYGKTVAAMKAACPLAADHMLLMLGVFTQYPILSLVHHPEVDYRHYLDMQMQAAVTDPVFAGIHGVGVWGSGYADEELHSWTLKLFRHYLIEGKTTLLSKEYGLQYLPGHVRNGDFRGGLSGWETAGEVRHDRIAKFGRDVLKRWWAPGGLGDEYALFVRGKEPGRIRQALKDLEPGRCYQLEFMSFDPREVNANKPGKRRHPIRAVLGTGAEVLRNNCWTWVDVGADGSGKRGKCGYVNLHHIVFVAHARDVGLSLDDSEALEGDEIGINSVAVKLALAEDVRRIGAFSSKGKGVIRWDLAECERSMYGVTNQLGRTIFEMDCDYPGRPGIGMHILGPGGLETLQLRIPEWVDLKRDGTIRINGKYLDLVPDSEGCVSISRSWKHGDRVHLYFPNPPRRVDVGNGLVEIRRGDTLLASSGETLADDVTFSVRLERRGLEVRQVVDASDGRVFAPTSLLEGARTRFLRTSGKVREEYQLETAQIQRLIDERSSEGGGRVTIAPGVHKSGTLYLKSGVELHLEKGAVLLASDRLEDYNALDAFPQNAGVASAEGWQAKHLIVCLEQENVSITGEGAIDGNGRAFFADGYFRTLGVEAWRDGGINSRDFRRAARPGQLVEFCESKNVRVEGVEFRDPAAWTLFFHGCENVEVSGVCIRGDKRHMNTDGIDIDACRHVRVSGCEIRTGDDAIAIRCATGRLKDKSRVCEDIVIENIIADVSACGCRIGVGDGVIRKVRLSGFRVESAGVGLYVQSAYRGVGGVDIRDITMSDSVLFDTSVAIRIEGANGLRPRGIRFEDVQVERTDYLPGKMVVVSDADDVSIAGVREFPRMR